MWVRGARRRISGVLRLIETGNAGYGRCLVALGCQELPLSMQLSL